MGDSYIDAHSEPAYSISVFFAKVREENAPPTPASLTLPSQAEGSQGGFNYSADQGGPSQEYEGDRYVSCLSNSPGWNGSVLLTFDRDQAPQRLLVAENHLGITKASLAGFCDGNALNESPAGAYLKADPEPFILVERLNQVSGRVYFESSDNDIWALAFATDAPKAENAFFAYSQPSPNVVVGEVRLDSLGSRFTVAGTSWFLAFSMRQNVYPYVLRAETHRPEATGDVQHVLEVPDTGTLEWIWSYRQCLVICNNRQSPRTV
ncbi:hypothetical protein ACRE_069930 [Hapsidospora chrysogenum ATCC 11550]|uniref:Uncharacterized protein n=1 Tax=Hapsidospora chrysogenum (strain ATCC 11550 / CBS 779.69 / DSM 880 / IAM 14645 / JCM 23072 / IMI 49137) TaxID=857340 RepID=A0A086SYS8_HAPC1|nr:hypothetical protein ACRE_069930 [Hapsidospora chrysogenum ATCC 11550]